NRVFVVARFNPNGTLDSSFHGAGFTIADFGTDSNDAALAVAIQKDGKIVAAGLAGPSDAPNLALARFNPDGSPYLTFDGNGQAVTDFGRSDLALALAIQKDGKIVAAGYSAGIGVDVDFALARYTRTGSLDASFDLDGKLTTDFGGSEICSAVALQ